jgi:DNA-binding response OmpR family regulator
MADKILIVDDDSDTVNFMKVMLGRYGYQVVAAMNGLQALELAHSENPDLIILDVMMPGIDGFEVARSLRRHPDTALTPILMFTAKTQVEDKLVGYNAGIDIYLTKPIHPVELQANIKALLLQRKARIESMAMKGYVTGIVAAKGGLGASTVALNLAIGYHQKHNVNVVAAEIRPGQGTWAQDLGLNLSTGLANLLRLNVPEITPTAVNEQLVPTHFGVRLLLASSSYKDVELATAIPQFEAVVQILSITAPLVILDIGTTFLPAFDVVIEQCDEIVLITEPLPPAVKRTYQLASELRSKGFGSAKALTIVTVNRTRSDMVMTMSQMEKILGQSVSLGFPPAAELAYTAAERNAPMILLQPEGIITQQFYNLADQIAHRAAQ